MSPLCARLSCLDVGPIVHAIKSVARGEAPDIADASDAAVELAELAELVKLPIAQIVSGTLTRAEALALLQDEAIGASDSRPPTLGRVDR